MLGKGLESLIPPNQSGQTPSDNGASQTPGLQEEKLLSSSVEPILIESVHETPTPSVPVSAPQRDAHLQNIQKEKQSKRPVSQEAIFQIEVEKIKPNPHQPRRDFNPEGIKELAASIREFGLLQPIVVTKVEKETPTGVAVEYELIAGERRLMAAKLLGLERVPAIVRSVDLERERLEMAIIENLQREDLNPIEMARAFSRLQEEFRLTQREIAARLGKSRGVVANTVRLLDLPPFIQEALTKNQITESHGRLLLTVDDPGAQKRLFEDLVANRLTTRELQNRVRTPKERTKSPQETLSPELKMFEEKLSAELGTPVLISRSGETGKITITFYSSEELQNIVRRLGADEEAAP